MKRTTAPDSVSGEYVDRDDGLTQKGTRVIAEDRNLIQEEIVNVSEMTGNVLDGGDDTQMETAIVETAGNYEIINANGTYTLESWNKNGVLIVQTPATAVTIAAGAGLNESSRLRVVNDAGATITVTRSGDPIDIADGSKIDLYYDGSVFITEQHLIFRDESNDEEVRPLLLTKVIEIGDWNMDLNSSASVAHGLSPSEFGGLRSVSAIIRDDADVLKYELATWNTGFL